MTMDLKSITVEELKREIENRETVKPLFVKDGKKYYDVASFNRLLAYFDEHGIPENYTPVQFNPNGTPKSAEPEHVVINLEAFVSNRVYVTGKEYHIVTDTRTIREANSGNITQAFIEEFILKENGKFASGYEVARGTVSREDFLRNYKDAFGIQDMLEILRIIDEYKTKHDEQGSLTFKKPAGK